MPPLAPTHGEKGGSSGGRQRQEAAAAAGVGSAGRQRQRSASFHGRGAERRHHHQLEKERPKTMPDLLAGVRGASLRSGSSPDGGGEAAGRRTPSKVLVSVAVQRSMWPLHVMASAEWAVADLVAAAVALYVKEGRRPPLPSADPAAFGLHYSQFSLENGCQVGQWTCQFMMIYQLKNKNPKECRPRSSTAILQFAQLLI